MPRYDTDTLEVGERYDGHWYREKVEYVRNVYEIRDVWRDGVLVTCEHRVPGRGWVEHREGWHMRPTHVEVVDGPSV